MGSWNLRVDEFGVASQILRFGVESSDLGEMEHYAGRDLVESGRVAFGN